MKPGQVALKKTSLWRQIHALGGCARSGDRGTARMGMMETKMLMENGLFKASPVRY